MLVGPTITFQLNGILSSLPLFCVFFFALAMALAFSTSSEPNDSATKAKGVKMR